MQDRLKEIDLLEIELKNRPNIAKLINFALYESGAMHFIEYFLEDSQTIDKSIQLKKDMLKGFKQSKFYKKGLVDEKQQSDTNNG